MTIGSKSRPSNPATDASLRSGTEERIHRHVLRAAHHRYGAEAALRSAVKLGVEEMLQAGASPVAVRHALTRCIDRHPSSLPDKPSLVTGESRVRTILGRMLAWAEDVMEPTMGVAISL